jgi:hypothetical protein
MRPESDLHYSLRTADLDLQAGRSIDLLLWVMGAMGALLLLVGGSISLLDWLDGRANSVLPALHALLVTLDAGGR